MWKVKLHVRLGTPLLVDGLLDKGSKARTIPASFLWRHWYMVEIMLTGRLIVESSAWMMDLLTASYSAQRRKRLDRSMFGGKGIRKERKKKCVRLCVSADWRAVYRMRGRWQTCLFTMGDWWSVWGATAGSASWGDPDTSLPSSNSRLSALAANFVKDNPT